MKTLILLALLSLLVGCSPSAFSQHYQAQTILAGSRAVAFAAVAEAQTAELQAAGEAFPDVGPERDAAGDAVGARFAPARVALDGILTALEAWQVAVSVARAADEDEALLPTLLDVAGGIVRLYADLVGLAGVLGVELPGLPSFLTSMVGGT